MIILLEEQNVGGAATPKSNSKTKNSNTKIY